MHAVETAQMTAYVADLRVAAEPVTIPVAFHVLTAEAGRGDVPDDHIEAQIDTLNSAFSRFGYRFALALVQRVEKPEWYDNLRIDSAEEFAMKDSLARDPSRFLNMYTASLALDYVGWAYLPDASSERFRGGGVVVLSGTLPGGSEAPFNLGHTGTHEVGHWAGLLHTFVDGCSEPNDGVADTPQERSGASGCPAARDSCPLDPGLDPVHNYMDYSDDACMTGFTDGQGLRADALLRQYRPTIATTRYAVATLPLGVYDEAFVGLTTTAELRVTNATDEPFVVSSASSSAIPVSVGGLPVTVAPGDVAVLPLSVSPTSSGPFETVVTLTTDSPDVGNLSVRAAGVAARPPTARLGREVAAVQLLEGQDATRTITLANDGEGPLTFAVDSSLLPEWLSVAPTLGTVAPGDSLVLTLAFASDVPEDTYTGTLTVVTNDPQRGAIEVPVALVVRERPRRLAVGPVYPNPGRGDISIPIELPGDADGVQITVFDTQGREVAVLGAGVSLPLGYPEATWDAGAVPAGLYLVRVTTPTDSRTARVVILR